MEQEGRKDGCMNDSTFLLGNPLVFARETLDKLFEWCTKCICHDGAMSYNFLAIRYYSVHPRYAQLYMFEIISPIYYRCVHL